MMLLLGSLDLAHPAHLHPMVIVRMQPGFPADLLQLPKLRV